MFVGLAACKFSMDLLVLYTFSEPSMMGMNIRSLWNA
jgi:hypothetical protein